METGDSPSAKSTPDATSVTTSNLPPLRILKSVRWAFRASWDTLGLTCSTSFTIFVACALPILIGSRVEEAIGRPVIGVIFGVAQYLLTVPPLFAGAAFLAYRVLSHDEPSYSDLWLGFKRVYLQSIVI